MLDKVQITINAGTFERLCKVRDSWRKEKGSVMAEQNIDFVICKLIDRFGLEEKAHEDWK